jgi:GxxExxY protein
VNKGIIYPELSYSIIGCAMDVHTTLGPCWDEWDYHRAMIRALESEGHIVFSHTRNDLLHRDEVVDHFELDLLVDHQIILELKHIRTAFHPEHFVQIINYLKRWDKRLGILINFGLERLVSKRVPYDSVSGSVHTSGEWDRVEAALPDLSNQTISAIKAILEQHGYGYSVRVFQNLLLRELIFRDLNVVKPFLKPEFKGLVLEEREADCILLDSKLLVSISATGQDASSTDLAYLKSYMRHLQISCGILIDIGRADIYLKGVC